MITGANIGARERVREERGRGTQRVGGVVYVTAVIKED